MPPYNLDDIDERDLSEAPRLAKDPESRGLMIAVAAVAVLFVALLVYSSFPELSPEEIISMDGYEGEQPTKTIFNIHSFDDTADEKTASASSLSEDNLPPIAETEPVLNEQSAVVTSVAEEADVENATIQSPVQEPVAEAELPIAVTEPVVDLPVAVTEPVAVDEPVVLAEPVVVAEPVPPVSTVVEDTPSRVITFSSASDERVVAAMATTPTIEEAVDTVVVASVAAIEPVPIPVGVSSQQSSGVETYRNNAQFLPLRLVLEDSTKLKASPSTRSKTLLTLNRGVFVTVFESDGEWIHIGTNDGSSITGYVLESALGQPEG